MEYKDYYGGNIVRDFFNANLTLFNEGCVVKYLFRAGLKGGGVKKTIDDLTKAINYLEDDIQNLRKHYRIRSLNCRVLFTQVLQTHTELTKDIPHGSDVRRILSCLYEDYNAMDLETAVGEIKQVISKLENGYGPR